MQNFGLKITYEKQLSRAKERVVDYACVSLKEKDIWLSHPNAQAARCSLIINNKYLVARYIMQVEKYSK